MKVYKVTRHSGSSQELSPLWRHKRYILGLNRPEHQISKLFAFNSLENAKASFKNNDDSFSIWECESKDAVLVYRVPMLIENYIPFWLGKDVPNQIECPKGTVVCSCLYLVKPCIIKYVPPVKKLEEPKPKPTLSLADLFGIGRKVLGI